MTRLYCRGSTHMYVWHTYKCLTPHTDILIHAHCQLLATLLPSHFPRCLSFTVSSILDFPSSCSSASNLVSTSRSSPLHLYFLSHSITPLMFKFLLFLFPFSSFPNLFHPNALLTPSLHLISSPKTKSQDNSIQRHKLLTT